MAQPQIRIGGELRDALSGSIEVFLKRGARTVVEFALRDLGSDYRVAIGDTVEVLDEADNIVWSGTVDDYEETSLLGIAGPTTARQYKTQCVGWEQRLDKRLTHDPLTGTSPCYTRNYYLEAVPLSDTFSTYPDFHNLSDGDIVMVKTSEGGTLPAPFNDPANLGQSFYVRDALPNSFYLSLAATLGGDAIDITDAGYGEHRLLTMRAGEIVTALLNDYAGDEEITVGSPSTVELGAVIDKAIFDGVTVWDAMNSMAEASGFNLWVDNDKQLHFAAKAIVADAPFAISDDSENYRAFSVHRTRESKVNQALVRLSRLHFAPNNEIFSGDGTTREWELSKPASDVVYIRVNDPEAVAFTETWPYTLDTGADLILTSAASIAEGEKVTFSTTALPPLPLYSFLTFWARDVIPGVSLKVSEVQGGAPVDITGGGAGVFSITVWHLGAWVERTFSQDGSSADVDFYFDVGTATIRQNPLRDVIAAGIGISVGYHALGGDIVAQEDTADISDTQTLEGGSGKYSKLFDKSDAGVSRADASNYATAIIDTRKAIGTEVTYETDGIVEPASLSLRPNQLQEIVQTNFSVTGNWLIDEVRLVDAATYFRYRVRALGVALVPDWLDYWRQLASTRTAAVNITATGGGRGESVPVDGVISYA